MHVADYLIMSIHLYIGDKNVTWGSGWGVPKSRVTNIGAKRINAFPLCCLGLHRAVHIN